MTDRTAVETIIAHSLRQIGTDEPTISAIIREMRASWGGKRIYFKKPPRQVLTPYPTSK